MREGRGDTETRGRGETIGDSASPCLRVAASAAGVIRILPFSTADGPDNMAADAVMLESAVAGVASLRFYTWDPPTVSLGYFQRHEERLRDPKLADLPFVRRATGGGAILHDRDLTYAIAMPATLRKGRTPVEWHCRIHHLLADLLRKQGVPVQVVSGQRRPHDELEYACFAIPQPGDVILDGRKVIGGAQRLRLGALLQHGSIQLPEAQRWAGDLSVCLAAALELEGTAADWTDDERARVRQLAAERYGDDRWNRKR